jgi:tyrosinase
MLNITRRSFVASAVTLPFLTWLDRLAGQMPTQTYVRYDATSPQGKAMLAIYASAVRKMKALPQGDPRGWLFQWYIHSLPRNKSAEITRIYGSGSSAAKTLAQASWKTCQAHNPPHVEDYFLPWHRAYVLYFENIVRAVSGEARFSLPYWNYTVTGAQHGVIPPEFRVTASPLYVANRNPGVNNGVPIDQGLDPTPINLDSLRNCYYDTGDGSGGSGFNPDLDQGLHGSVHDLTGNGQNMGSVPWAANDPVFWTHHGQIDRIWYSWQKAGRTTPPMSYNFTFVNPDGSSATVDLSQFLDYTKLPYAYDSYVDVPACPPRPQRLMAQQEEVLAARRESQRVTLGRTPTVVTLAPRGEANAAPRTLATRISTIPSENRVYLVLRDVRTNQTPGVLYQVFVQLPANASRRAAREYHAGYINFFEATSDGEQHRSPTFRFDITALARRLAGGAALDAGFRVTIRPAGTRAPAAYARPSIGDIVITQQ